MTGHPVLLSLEILAFLSFDSFHFHDQALLPQFLALVSEHAQHVAEERICHNTSNVGILGQCQHLYAESFLLFSRRHLGSVPQ